VQVLLGTHASSAKFLSQSALNVVQEIGITMP
jgi:hypothetical protein